MARESSLHVSNPPPKPLMIWDGDCHFCRRWIERWRVLTGGAIDYETFQDAQQRFPEIAPEQFQRAVAYIDQTGQVFTGAEAVYRSLTSRRSKRWLAWSYDHIPGFAWTSELGYKIIARNRRFSSAITRMLWGKDVRPPTYFSTRGWFLRALGLVYLVAFISFWIQVDGLVGTNGVLPLTDFLTAAQDQLGSRAWSFFPTLCWFNASNGFLQFLCGAGVLFSALLIVGVAPAICLVLLFALYLSLTIAGQEFLSFQWDILLLEAGFLAIFFAPWQLWPVRGRPAPVSCVGLFLLKLLLFKLMLMSGVVKLTSGDDCWWNLTALDFHYWSQPLPTVFAWWADQHPEWFKKFSVAFCLIVEIVVPFFIWGPRRIRLAAAGLMIFLQLAIAITGNYCFFNLLTIALCLLLIDDAVIWRKREHSEMGGRASVSPINPASRELRPPLFVGTQRLSAFGAVVVMIVTLPVNGWLIYTAFKPLAEWPKPIAYIYAYLEPFRLANGYGLFRVMTKDRGEIVIEGSADGFDWRAYEFKWKPGDVNRAPGWCAPHQPRLDWQMWFAALGTPQQNRWFLRLIGCLLQNKRDVTRLLAINPFPESPPRYIRASFYRYRFTTNEEHRQTRAWWKRRELGEYLPTVSLNRDER